MPSDEIRERIRRRLDEQRSLVRTLISQRELLQGSLFVRYGTCGKINCGCRTGQRHGPYYVLSTSARGRGFAYLDAAQAREARRQVERYRRFRAGLRRLRQLNVELVTLLKRHQTRANREAARRLKLAPSRVTKTSM